MKVLVLQDIRSHRRHGDIGMPLFIRRSYFSIVQKSFMPKMVPNMASNRAILMSSSFQMADKNQPTTSSLRKRHRKTPIAPLNKTAQSENGNICNPASYLVLQNLAKSFQWNPVCARAGKRCTQDKRQSLQHRSSCVCICTMQQLQLG